MMKRAWVLWPAFFLLPSLGQAQVFDFTDVQGLTSVPDMRGQVTWGDLDGNGTPDLVVANGAALCRVYFFDNQSAPGNLTEIDVEDVLLPAPYPPLGSLKSVSLPAQTQSRWGMETPVVYDIDLDGRNDLIYLKHSVVAGAKELFLEVFSYVGNPGSGSFVQRLGASAPKINDLMLNGGSGYWGLPDNNNLPVKAGREFSFFVANFRGRAVPQDIVVFSDPPNSPYHARAFGLDVGAGGQLTFQVLFEYGRGDVPDNAWKSEPGHNLRVADLDLDGKDELYGNTVIKHTPPSGMEVVWGMHLKRDISQPSFPNDVHVDHAEAADVCQSVLRSDGTYWPSPGMEIVAAVQTGSPAQVFPGYNSPDPSALRIYRAVSGHTDLGIADCASAPRMWPRLVLNRVLGFGVAGLLPDGCLYDYASPGPTWNEPNVPGGALWSLLGNALPGPSFNNFDANTQSILIGDFIDGLEGQEIVAFCKQHVNGSAGTWFGHTYFMADGTGSFAVQAFDESDSVNELRGPGGLSTYVVDFLGSSDELEIASLNFGVSSDNVLVSKFVQATTGTRPYTAAVLSMPETSGAGGDAFMPYDVFGDSREEVTTFRGGPNPRLRIMREPGPLQTRTTPSPTRFLDYNRTRIGRGVAYGQYVPFQDFSGPRFYTKVLPKGEAGVPYGVLQGQALTGITGAAIVVEGGVGPYSIEISPAGDPLPQGLTTNFFALPGARAALAISGTPLEPGTRRLQVVAKDLAPGGETFLRDYWIVVEEGPVGGLDSKPMIVSATYSDANGPGIFLSASTGGNITVDVKVEDHNNDVIGVEVFERSLGLFLGLATPQGNGVFRFSTVIPPLPAATDTYLMFRATDAALNRSPFWPLLTVPGAETDVKPPVGPFAPAAANPPLIARVSFDNVFGTSANHPEPAEQVDEPFLLTVSVNTDLTGAEYPSDIVTVSCRHVLEEVDPIQATAKWDAATGSYVADLLLPAGWAGWGTYAIEVQASRGGVLSDVWPRLRLH